MTRRIVRHILIAAILTLGVTMSASAQPRNSKRITFPPGRTTTVLKGVLRGPNDFTYILRAQKGQTLLAHISVGGDGQASLLIKGPDNRSLTNADGSDAGDDFSIILQRTGDYRIVVFPPEMTEKRDIARYTLEVTIR